MVGPRRARDDDGCPCGTGAPYGGCCGPYVDDGVPAPTAEAVMRSRYTAYVLHRADHLLRTWHPATRPAELTFDPTLIWEGLAVRRCVAGQPGDADGVVEFRARWRRDIPPAGPGVAASAVMAGRAGPPDTAGAPDGVAAGESLAGGVLRERSVFRCRGGRWLYLHAADDPTADPTADPADETADVAPPGQIEDAPGA